MPGKVSKLAIDGSGEGVSLARTILGDVGPNLDEVLQRLRAYYNGRHLLGVRSAGRGKLAALPLYFGYAPRARRAAFQAFADVAPQPFELKSVQLVLRLHEAQGFAHYLAGGVVASGFNFLANQLFELRGEVDVEGHGVQSVQLSRYCDWQGLSIIGRMVSALVIRDCPSYGRSQQPFFAPTVAKPVEGTPPVSPRIPVPIVPLLALAGANNTKPAASPVVELTTKFTKILLPMT